MAGESIDDIDYEQKSRTEAEDQEYYEETKKLKELREALKNIEHVEIPFNIINTKIVPLISWLDYRLSEN